MEVVEIIESIKKLDTQERQIVFQELLKDEAVSVTEIIIANVAKLESFRQKARNDIPKIAEAGLELGEKEMRKVTKIGGHSRKKSDNFKLAMIKCLLDAGAWRGTEYRKEIESGDFTPIDKDWYKSTWLPETSEDSK